MNKELTFWTAPLYNQEYPALIVTDQQFVDRLPLLGYGTNRAEDAQPLDMEAGVQVVEEGVLRVLLTGIGVGEHSFASFLSQVLAESGQFYLAVVNEAGACTSYMPDDFDDDCQIELAGFCKDLGEKGSK